MLTAIFIGLCYLLFGTGFAAGVLITLGIYDPATWVEKVAGFFVLSFLWPLSLVLVWYWVRQDWYV